SGVDWASLLVRCAATLNRGVPLIAKALTAPVTKFLRFMLISHLSMLFLVSGNPFYSRYTFLLPSHKMHRRNCYPAEVAGASLLFIILLSMSTLMWRFIAA